MSGYNEFADKYMCQPIKLKFPLARKQDCPRCDQSVIMREPLADWECADPGCSYRKRGNVAQGID